MLTTRVLCSSASLLVVCLLIGAVEVCGCIVCLRGSQRLACSVRSPARARHLCVLCPMLTRRPSPAGKLHRREHVGCDAITGEGQATGLCWRRACTGAAPAFCCRLHLPGRSAPGGGPCQPRSVFSDESAAGWRQPPRCQRHCWCPGFGGHGCGSSRCCREPLAQHGRLPSV